jgi:hypothetical protein
MSARELSAILVCSLAGGGQEKGGAPAAPATADHVIEVRVDRRVELLTLVARLAGFDEFNQANSKSPYSRAADAWFREQRDHPAVKRLQELRKSNGVGFDAIPMLAVHLEDSVALEERVAFDTPPERLDQRWGGADARAFLVLLRDFVKAADSEGFFDSQEERFAGAAERLRAVIEKSRALPWFDRTFGARSGASYVAIPGLLCGGGNYGVGIRYPPRATANGTEIDEEILPVFGCSRFDDAGIPLFGDEMAGLLVHELCHSYTNALVDRIAPQLEPSAKRLFDGKADAMRRQAYGDWKTMCYESLVRASVVRCRSVTEGAAAGRAQEAEEVGRSFVWVPALAVELARYDADRKQWPTFVDFLPEIVKCFAREAAKLDADQAK